MKTTVSVNRSTLAANVTIVLDGGEPSQPFKVEWGDGTAPTQLASGTLTASHTYAKPGGYEVIVKGNDLRTTEHVAVGDQLHAYTPEKYTKTPAQMQDRERQRAAVIAGQVKAGTHG